MARRQRKPGWFNQARKDESAFGANVMDPGSNIESEEKIVKSADGTVTKTTVSNKQNTPAFQGMQTEQTQGGVEKETQKSYSPEQISSFDQSNMGAGDFGTSYSGGPTQANYENRSLVERIVANNANQPGSVFDGPMTDPWAQPEPTAPTAPLVPTDRRAMAAQQRALAQAGTPTDIQGVKAANLEAANQERAMREQEQDLVSQGIIPPSEFDISGFGRTANAPFEEQPAMAAAEEQQAQVEQIQAGVEAGLISPEQISAFDQGNMGAGDEPQAAYTPEQFEAMRAEAIADSGVATYTRSDGSTAQAIPGSPEALGLEAMGYAEGGVGAASLVNPGVIGDAVLPTQQEAQDKMIEDAGAKAAAEAFDANQALGNQSVISNTVAADEARAAAEQSVISDFEVANDPTLAQAQVEAQAEVQAEVQAKAQAAIDALDEAEANAPDDSGDMGGYDEAQTQAQLDQAIKDTQDRLAAGDDPKSMIDKISKWYGDNPVLAKALIGAVASYVKTGNIYSALGAGLEGGVGALDSIAAGKAEAAKEAKALKTWFLKDNYNHAQALQLQDRKINSATASAAVKAEAEKTKAELTYSKDLTSRLEDKFDKETLRKFFPVNLRGQVSGGLKFVRDSLGVDVSNPSLATDTSMHAGMKRYMDHLERNPEQKGKAKFKSFFAEAVIQRRAVDRGIDAGLFIGANSKSNPEAAMKAYKTIQAKSRKFDGNTEETWIRLQTAFLEFKATDNYDTMVGLAEKKDIPPFIYFINHEVNLVE